MPSTRTTRILGALTSDASWVDAMPEVYERCLVPALFAPFAEHVAARATELTALLGQGPVTGDLAAFVVTARPA